MHVLDVGCATGAISAGIAKIVGSKGSVTGIDHTKAFIDNGQTAFSEVKNLDLLHADIFTFEPNQKYDLIVSARVLQWRSDAGMNNQISESLSVYFKNIGLKNIEIEVSNGLYEKGQPNFESKVGIQSKVANSTQMIKEGYIKKEEQQLVINEFNGWIQDSAERMEMKLKEVRGWK